MRTAKPARQFGPEAAGARTGPDGGQVNGGGLVEGKVSVSYALKVGRPSYSSEEIALSVSFPVFGEGPEGLEAAVAEAHAQGVRALEARVHDLFAEIEAKRAAEAKR